MPGLSVRSPLQQASCAQLCQHLQVEALSSFLASCLVEEPRCLLLHAFHPLKSTTGSIDTDGLAFNTHGFPKSRALTLQRV